MGPTLAVLGLSCLGAAALDPLSPPLRPQDKVATAEAASWPGFRGVGTGHTRALNLPTVWSDETNVAWKIDLPGFGQSSPVVWGDRVFVTAVSGEQKETCIVAAYGLESGEPLWKYTSEASLQIASSEMVSRGAPTPAIDSERLYAFFESGDFVALDHQGAELWRRSLSADYGAFEGNHGIASSVVLSPSGPLVLVDHGGPSYLLAMEAATGANRWRLERTPRVSWTTPVWASEHELVISSNGGVDGIDVRDGSVRWTVGDLRGNTAASPTVVGDSVLVASSEGEANLRLRRGAQDDSIVWRPGKARPSGFGSPMVADGRVFIVSKSGTLSAFSFESGALLWEQRIPESTWASPISADGKLWFFGKEGTTLVLRADDDGAEILGENQLSVESTVYAAAAVQGTILLRTGTKLIALRVDASSD